MKTHGRVALDRGEWTASCPGRLTPREGAPGVHWIGGWVSTTACLEAVNYRKVSLPWRESNPGRPATRYTD
jgi:hypothetical protein